MDVIDKLAALLPESHLRAARPVARENAQKSHDALFSPEGGTMPLGERLTIAVFVAGLHRDTPSLDYYAARLAQSDAAGLAPAIAAATEAGLTEGPYGVFPAGPLSAEDQPGAGFSADAGALGPRLAAAFEHTHLLIFHPRDAHRPAMAALVAAGWSATDIVSLSQLVAFLSFQIRAAAGLKVLAAS